MNTPIILAAFGTTSRALSTYQVMDQYIRRHFADTPIFWAYTSGTVNRRMQEKSGGDYPSLAAILSNISGQGHSNALVQSLHVLPGHEFHQLLAECRQADIPCRFGMPLLTAPQDYERLADCLAPLITARPDKAILLIGHGTDHPIWVAYHALECIFQRRFGKQIFIGTIEKNPPAEAVPQEIAAAGFRQVCMIPLLLVAGMHYQRDVIGEGENSWRSRLERQGLDVESIAGGLGLIPGISNIIATHIREALSLTGEQACSTTR
jgi:sirohydrochlorin cobaltochelatase